MTDRAVEHPGAVDLPGWTHVYSGKVRDLYVPAVAAGRSNTLADTDFVLVVASDRVSAFDFVLEPGITGKGALLTELSLWWFGQLKGVANHLVDPAAAAADGVVVPESVRDRSMLAKPLDMFPIECVVRGYLVGSGWAEYQVSGTVCGVALPAGLSDGDRLPEPIYTPAFKADLGDHDENITFERTVELVGAETAAALRDRSMAVYALGAAIAESRGVILADTKFEFGADRVTGELTLADEVLTSDSSRYWDAAVYAAGSAPAAAGSAPAAAGSAPAAASGVSRTESFDKQIVRDWLSAHWDKTGTPPELPADIVARTSARYRELLERLTA